MLKAIQCDACGSAMTVSKMTEVQQVACPQCRHVITVQPSAIDKNTIVGNRYQLKERFEKRYTDSVDELLENIYKKPLPNRFIAQYSRFVFHHKNDPFMASLIQSVFNDFFEVKVLRFHKEYDWPLNIVGSIGFYFQDEIRRIAHDKNIRIRRIIEKPIARLGCVVHSIETS